MSQDRQQPLARAGADGAAGPDAGGTRRSVLVVDDDIDFAASLAGLLQLDGYDVAVAHDPEAALTCLDRQSIAVALVDVRLGLGNGIDLVRSLRRRDPDLVCVMVTAFASIDTAVEALQAGAYDYLCKPFHSEDLLATLARCFERITLYAQNRRAAERLGQIQRMEAVGQLTSGVAHDFNNVLAVLYANLRLLQERVTDQPALLELVDDALDAAGAGTELTERLLAFGRVQPTNTTVTDLREQLPPLMRMLRRTLGETIAISLRMDGDLDALDINRIQLETSLLNLAINARDAMPDGGDLRFDARNTIITPDHAHAVPGLLPGRYVVLSVIDTGHGMSPAVRGRALEPFFSTKTPGHGSGLGLAMVDSFVRLSGGRLAIDSAPGQGTTVNLYLPRAAAGAVQASGGGANM
ncbi:response regulator [Phreatobacter stygius]|uniref:histidine kinase n=1 Tax=Phreatobacter stygius TaxID=1940610 RepID=A0A4D7B756_9HYPH|nr:response regulator [Phreatobacter stygius]QCI63982.1 response regulator [Phreatobacter stygius]